MGTENQQPSGGISDLNARYGGTTLSTGAYADPQDLPLRRSRRDLRGEYRTAGVEEGRIPGQLPSAPVLKKQSEVELELYSMADKDVPELQRRLWAGGFYPPSTNPDELVPGDRDPYTEAAWKAAIARATKFHAAGRDVTLDEVIEMGANLEGAAGARGRGAGGRQPLVVELANPEDLKYYAQKTAVSVLGRGLKPDELSRFVSSFQAAQTGAQTQAYNQSQVGGAGGAVVGAPSTEAAAATFARQTAPAEAGAHDFVRVYDAFSKMLGGKRGRG